MKYALNGIVSFFRQGRSTAVQPETESAQPEMAVASGTSTGSGKVVTTETPPKPPRPGGVTVPQVFTSAKPDPTQTISEKDRATAKTNLASLVDNRSTKNTVENLARVTPELSSAVDSYLRVGLTPYHIRANNVDGSINPEATKLAMQIAKNFDTVGDYADGFNNVDSILTLGEKLARELRYRGSCSIELVLSKARTPKKIVAVGTKGIKWRPAKDARGLVPFQDMNGEEVDLNIPNYFYTSLDQSLYSAYSESPLEPAIQPVLFALDFINDVRRVIRRAIHPRLVISLDTEEVKNLMPLDVRNDSKQMTDFIDTLLSAVKEQIDGLAPEDAMVQLDLIEASILDRGNTSLDSEYKAITSILDAKMASGAKTLPAVIGKGDNQSTASVQAMLFIKAVATAQQAKLAELFSRAFTLALRLLGQDVYATFVYEDINLRPALELEGFLAQRQSRVLDLLSLGMISDEDAALTLTNRLPGPTFKPLSGTGFRAAAGSNVDPTQNNYSGTSVGGDGGGGSLNENLKPDTSAAKRGDQGKKGTK